MRRNKLSYNRPIIVWQSITRMHAPGWSKLWSYERTPFTRIYGYTLYIWLCTVRMTEIVIVCTPLFIRHATVADATPAFNKEFTSRGSRGQLCLVPCVPLMKVIFTSLHTHVIRTSYFYTPNVCMDIKLFVWPSNVCHAYVHRIAVRASYVWSLIVWSSNNLVCIHTLHAHVVFLYTKRMHGHCSYDHPMFVMRTCIVLPCVHRMYGH